MVHVTSNCKVVVTANEGEATFDSAGTFINPEGSVSVFTFDSLDQPPVATREVIEAIAASPS